MAEGLTPRRRQILEALAGELEESPGARITTARLAEVVGVSEAALYRHFPSKARMFEMLIEFAEESVFGLVNRILREERDPADRCAQIMRVILTFAERNPGITRVLLGEALVGEAEGLRERVSRFFDRLETQLRQVLRESELPPDGGGGAGAGIGLDGMTPARSAGAGAALLIGVAEGKMRRYLRTGFRHPPLAGWEAQWPLLRAGLALPSAGPGPGSS